MFRKTKAIRERCFRLDMDARDFIICARNNESNGEAASPIFHGLFLKHPRTIHSDSEQVLLSFEEDKRLDLEPKSG